MNSIWWGLAWLAGLWSGGSLGIDIGVLVLAGLVSVAGAALVRRHDPRLALILALLFAFCAGAARQLAAQPCFGRFSPTTPCPVTTDIRQHNDGYLPLTITGVVDDAPQVGDRVIRLRVRVETVQLAPADEPQPLSGLVLVQAARYPEIPYGARVRVSGKLETPFESAEFSYRDHLARQGIYSVMSWPRVVVLESDQGSPWRSALLRFRENAVGTIERTVPAPEAGLLQAMLLGESRYLAPALSEPFRATGMAHVIAISGFHVAILTVVVAGVAEAFLPRRWAVFVTMAVLIGYALLVGARPSVVRATVMGIIYLVGTRLIGRSGFSLAALFTAAILMTGWNPLIIEDVGFQLSFAATLGIILCTGPVERQVRRSLRHRFPALPRDGALWSLLSLLIVSAVAQLFTLPLTLAHFSHLAPLALLVNLLVVPLLPAALVLGGLAVLGGMAWLPIGRIAGLTAWLFLRWATFVVEGVATLPFASLAIDLAHPQRFVIGAYLSLVAGAGWLSLTRERRAVWQRLLARNLSRRLALGTLGVAAFLVAGWHLSQPDGDLHVTFFDVGQGDALLIRTPTGRHILVDGGYYPAVLGRHLGRALPFWQREIDLIIATHADADHVSGLPPLFGRYRIGRLLVSDTERGASAVYDALFEQAELHGVPIEPARAGEVIVVDDGVRLEILHPGEVLDGANRNDNSVVVRLVYGNFVALLTGDAEESAENGLIASGIPLHATVLKAGHHGSHSSTTEPFLEAVRPAMAIISAGRGNNFGHPHAEVLERLNRRGVAILRTDELGTIRVRTDGEQMWWDAWR
jgi:competence protein ComEC